MKKINLLGSTILCSGIVLAALSSPARADESLKAQIEDLQTRLIQLEQKEDAQEQALKAQQAASAQAVREASQAKAALAALSQAKPASDNYVTGGDFPGTFKLPGTNVSVGIHGFVNFQGIYDFTQNAGLGPKFQIGNLEPAGSVDRRETADTFQFQDKVSRLVVETRTPTEWGQFKTIIASDFYAPSFKSDHRLAVENNNGIGARLVYAYGTLGHWTFGQALSNFVDDPDQADTFDNSGPAGVPSLRNPQVRYTTDLGPGAVSFSIETPATSFATVTNGAAGTESDELDDNRGTEHAPDFTAKYEINKPWGHAQASMLLTRPGYNDGAGDSVSKVAVGGIVGGTLNLKTLDKGFDDDYVGAQAWYGDLGRYIPDDFGANMASLLALNLSSSGRILASQLQPVEGGTLFVEHYWTSQIRSALAFGYIHQQLPSFADPTDVAIAVTDETVHTNLVWSPVPRIDLGAEFMWGKKRFMPGVTTDSGHSAEAERVEFGGKFRF